MAQLAASDPLEDVTNLSGAPAAKGATALDGGPGLKDWQATGCCVRLLKSNEIQEQDEGCERMITASFTAGPKAAAFEIKFHCQSFDPEEGVETAVIDSDLFMVEDDSCEEVDNEDIDEFLQRAGLLDARPQRPRNDDGDLSTARRRRWVYGDVIYDAVGLVEEKHPPPEDDCGLGIGMSEPDIYGYLGLPW